MRPPIRSWLFVVLAAVAPLPFVSVASCGGGTPTPTAPTVATTAAPTDTASGAPVVVPSVWNKDAMSKEQRVAFMKQNVVPRMQKVFQDHDAKDYASFGCVTCHGPDFKDPKEFLPKLHVVGGKMTEFDTKPEFAKWMAEKVAPEMASAMGLEPFDPQTHQGFGCAGCHPVEMK